MLGSEVGRVLRNDWNVEPEAVLGILEGTHASPSARLLGSILSGPIDIDKMDYLERDSRHAGVPYGRNYDKQRLIQSLTLDAAGTGLAITAKGRTAAELMVFARYVMFSEVYWHHAVRSATAMLTRAFLELHRSLPLDDLLTMGDADLVRAMQQAAGDGPVEVSVAGVGTLGAAAFASAGAAGAGPLVSILVRLAAGSSAPSGSRSLETLVGDAGGSGASCISWSLGCADGTCKSLLGIS